MKCLEVGCDRQNSESQQSIRHHRMPIVKDIFAIKQPNWCMCILYTQYYYLQIFYSFELKKICSSAYFVKIAKFSYCIIGFLTNFAIAYRLQKPDMGHVGGQADIIIKRLLTLLLDGLKSCKFLISVKNEAMLDALRI